MKRQEIILYLKDKPVLERELKRFMDKYLQAIKITDSEEPPVINIRPQGTYYETAWAGIPF